MRCLSSTAPLRFMITVVAVGTGLSACTTSDATGTGGRGGTTGAAGAAGATGAAGTTGAAGSTGSAGATGAAGGVGGAGGSGAAGTGAAAGADGTAGASGGAGGGGRGGAGGSAGGGQGGAGGGRAGQGGGGAGGRGGGGGSVIGGAGGTATGAGGAPADGGTSDAARDATGDASASYLPCPTTAGTACAILPLGDSITEGYLPTGDNGGYRVELFNQAVLAGKNITFVGSQMNGPATVQNRTFPNRHEGHGGYTISGGGNGGIAGSITDTAISTYHPNIVLLMLGTNDINDNIDVANAPSRLGKLIDEIITDSPAALVVVASIMPIANNTTQAVQTYNAAIPGLVSARAGAGKHVLFVDNYAAVVKNPSYKTALMVDNLHPNDVGYALLGQTFYGAISTLLPSGP